ncbi:MAG: hypothetical protein Q9169_006914 [Polycauliona sp. 2 TL-2023]
MPGLLRSEHDDRQDLSSSRRLQTKASMVAEHDATNHIEDNKQGEDSSATNGYLGDVIQYQTNGNPSATQPSPANGSTRAGDFSKQLPPEIAQITMGYLPLSDLVTRLVQDTFNGMTEVINEISELQMPQSNGSIPVNQFSQGNVQKKLRVLDFVQDRRAKFIKILVLSQWSRRAGSVSRVIDLKAWLDAQTCQYDGACSWIGELRRIMAFERIPNPDLPTALEALSLGTIPALPDLGYLPPKQVPPKRLLKALRGINTQLAIRLRLHEAIPPSLKNSSISNGRVTFRAPYEFELDLSIADENPSSQLYFIDFRFLFSPTPEGIAQGFLRNDLEARINMLLGNQGLKGCYGFLHNFVLSHKLNIFRHQAHRMSQANWSEHLKVEAVHRSLVLQYWVTRPGPKSWIELGIRRRNGKRLSWLHDDEDGSHIGVRWFRAGKEVTKVPLMIDLENLSVEACLKRIISAHTNAILKETRTNLTEGRLYAGKTLRLKHHRSTTEPATSSLLVQLTGSQSCTIMQEPVSGRIVFLPPSLLYSRTERDVNGLTSPEKTTSTCIAHLRSTASCEEVERTLRCYGWTVVNSVRPNQDQVRHYFGRETLRASFFRKKSWDAHWLFAFTSSLGEESWWIIELVDSGSRVDPTAVPGLSIRAVFKVPSNANMPASRELSYLGLSQIETIAVGMISQHTDSRHLALQKIPHKFVKTSFTRASSDMPALYIRLPEFRIRRLVGAPRFAKTPRLSQAVRLSFVGTDESDSYANHLVTARSNCATLRARSLYSADGYLVSFHPTSDAFTFRLRAAVGTSAIPSLLDCLAKIQRLIDYISALQASKVHHLSLSHVEFTYATEPHDLRAKMSFVDERPPQISFEHKNPHLRIQDRLTVMLQGPDGLKHVILLLSVTLPLMRALAALEAVHGQDMVAILSRSAEWHQIRLRKDVGTFDVRLRRRREALMWFVEEATSPDGTNTVSRVHEEFRGLTKAKGKGWMGMSPGIVASLSGVEALLKRMGEEVFQDVPAMEPAPMTDARDYKAQKRKREDDEVVVLD